LLSPLSQVRVLGLAIIHWSRMLQRDHYRFADGAGAPAFLWPIPEEGGVVFEAGSEAAMAHLSGVGSGGESGRRRASRARVEARAASEGVRETGRASLYDEVTAQIIAELEAGRFPWVQPWSNAAAAPGLPRNATTSRAYSGVNVLILWGAVIAGDYANQGWLTFRQTLAAGLGPEHGAVRLHFYPFGGIAKTVDWILSYEIREAEKAPMRFET
jgi:N-terminal domain of anti-restriction factor ArdC